MQENHGSPVQRPGQPDDLLQVQFRHVQQLTRLGAGYVRRHHPELRVLRVRLFQEGDVLLDVGDLRPIGRNRRLRDPLADAGVGVLRLVLVNQQARRPAGLRDVKPAQNGRLFRGLVGVQIDQVADRHARRVRRRRGRADQRHDDGHGGQQPQQPQHPT